MSHLGPFNPPTFEGGSTDNKFKFINFGVATPDVVLGQLGAAKTINNLDLNSELLTVSADEIPVFFGVVFPADKSPENFKGFYVVNGKGKGTYGLNGTITLTANDLERIEKEETQDATNGGGFDGGLIEVIETDPNAHVENLGEIGIENIIDHLNANHTFVIGAKTWYFDLTRNGKRLFYIFTGNQGTYGLGETPFTTENTYLMFTEAMPNAGKIEIEGISFDYRPTLTNDGGYPMPGDMALNNFENNGVFAKTLVLGSGDPFLFASWEKVDIENKEDKANKATNFEVINDFLYPTTKAVKDNIDLVVLAQEDALSLKSDISQTGRRLTANQATSTINLVDANGVVLDSLAVGFLNNEGTVLVFNPTSETIDMKNDAGEILSSIPISSFLTNIGSNLNLVGSSLQLRDTANAVMSTVVLTVDNVSNLQTILNNKLDKNGDGSGLTNINKRVFDTSDTGSTNQNKWTKICNIDITNRYGSVIFEVNMFSRNTDTNVILESLEVKVMQQNPFGLDPIVNIKHFNKYGLTVHNQFGYKLVSNTPTTVVEIYQKSIRTYSSTIGYLQTHNFSSTNIDFLSNQTFSATIADIVVVPTVVMLTSDSEIDANTLDGLDSEDFVRKTGGVTDHITGTKFFDDGSRIVLGTLGGAKFFHSVSKTYLDLKIGDFIIRDNFTERFRFTKSTGEFKATSFKRTGGTPEQSLMADGSVKVFANILETSFILDDTQLKNVGTTTIGVLPALDSNQFYDVLSVSYYYTYLLEVFDNLKILNIGGFTTTNLQTATTSGIYKFAPNSFNYIVPQLGEALTVSSPSPNSTTGKGQAKFFVTYRIVTV